MSNMETKIVVQKNSFGIKLVHCGIESKKDHYENSRKIDRYVISLLTKGKGYYTLNGKRFVIKQGDIYAKFQNETFSQETDKSDPYEYYYVAFIGGDCLQVLEHAGLTLNSPVISLDELIGKQILKKMKAIYNNLGEDSYLNIAKSVVNLLEIFCILFERKKENVVKQEDSYLYVEEVKKYIDEHITEHLKVNELSRHIRIDRAYLSHLFKKTEKISIKEYIDKYKMDKAMVLLREGKVHVSKISNYLGYENYITFYRQFLKYVGCSPAEYKQKNTKSIIEYKENSEN